MADGFLGIDLGTGSVKALVVDEAGRTLAGASVEYPVLRPRPGWAEQDPEEWWRATVSAVRAAVANLGLTSIVAIGLSGQMHGTVLLDRRNQLLGNAIIWADARSAGEAKEITERVGEAEVIARNGSRLSTGFQAATLAWVRANDPTRWALIATVLLPKDYLRFRLTGGFATDASDASGTLLLDVRTCNWSPTMLDAIGLFAEQLPVVGASDSAALRLSRDVAVELGLAPGIPVVAGGGDAPLAALAAGVVDPETMLLTISSGSQVLVPTPEPRPDPLGRIHAWRHCLDPSSGAGWHQMGATLVSGLALRWLRDQIFGLDAADAYERMTSGAAETPVGANGLIFLPYLAGERTPHLDPLARGLFLGLTAEHERGHLVRAVLEGATLALFDAYDVLVSLGAAPREAILAGGGARSRPWRQIVSDVFGLPIRPLANVEGSALGAALLAGAGVGRWNAAEQARRWARYDAAVEPHPTAHERYRELLEIFRTAYVNNREAFAALGRMA